MNRKLFVILAIGAMALTLITSSDLKLTSAQTGNALEQANPNAPFQRYGE